MEDEFGFLNKIMAKFCFFYFGSGVGRIQEELERFRKGGDFILFFLEFFGNII